MNDLSLARPLRALLVEDEPLLLMEISDLVEDLGFAVEATAMNLADALNQAKAADVDFAILDLNLRGELSVPVAAALKDRSIPFIIASGYENKAIAADFGDRPRLSKPYSADDIRAAIACLFATV